MTTFASDGSPVKSTPTDDAPQEPAALPAAPTEHVIADNTDPEPVDAAAADASPSSDDGEPDAEDALDAGWEHEWLEFEGDRLAIRKPTQRALSGVTLGASKFISADTSTAITGKFIELHLGPDSYRQVFSRLMNSDDPAYTDDSLRDLIQAIAKTATSKAIGDDDAR